VLIVDDVITAGTAIREAVDLIRSAGATPVGVVLALDRQERGQTALSAVQEVEQGLRLPVKSILKLADLISHLQKTGDAQQLAAMQRYKNEYGVAA
jgi:orotate phosphoribosyltransferase